MDNYDKLSKQQLIDRCRYLDKQLTLEIHLRLSYEDEVKNGKKETIKGSKIKEK